MILIWTPADAEPRTFTFRPDDMPPAEYEAIEDVGRWASLEEFNDAVRASARSAWRVALWICLRRENPALALDDVQPKPLEVSMSYEPAEELALAEIGLADPETPDDLRAMFEARRLELLGKDRPGTAPEPSPTSGEPAAGTSPTTSTSARTRKRR